MLTQIKNISSIPLLLEEKFCVSIVDRCGIILYVTPLFCELSKYNEEELIGKSYDLLHPAYSAAQFIAEMEQEWNDNKVVQRRMKRITKEGSVYWVHTTIVPIFDENQQIIQ